MPTIVREPQDNETPDATLGGNAVTGVSDTGHASTVTPSSANTGSDSDEKSARWFGLENYGGFRISVRLQLSWTASGIASAVDDGEGGTASGSATFTLEYTVDGGDNWTEIVTDNATAEAPGTPDADFTNNDSADIALSSDVDLSLVEVRGDYTTSAASSGLGNNGSASVTVVVSGIQVEIVAPDAIGKPICIGF